MLPGYRAAALLERAARRGRPHREGRRAPRALGLERRRAHPPRCDRLEALLRYGEPATAARRRRDDRRRAAPRHDLAVGLEGDRHRPQLRPRRPPHRARHRVHARPGAPLLGRAAPLDGRRARRGRRAAARPHDRVRACFDPSRRRAICSTSSPREPTSSVDVLGGGRAALEAANRELRPRALGRRDRLPADAFGALGRNPSDVELMMFAQANSEHCRHKIFNAELHDRRRAAAALAVRR